MSTAGFRSLFAFWMGGGMSDAAVIIPQAPLQRVARPVLQQVRQAIAVLYK